MKLKYYITGIIIILLDQLSKILMINKYITIIPNFLEFNYTQNFAGAFGIGNQNIVLVFSVLLISSVILFLIIENKKIKNYIPFVLILSGSIGNLLDRFFRGYVIDFIKINIFNFPNFNIADICIVTGIGILIYILILKIIKSNKSSKKSIE